MTRLQRAAALASTAGLVFVDRQERETPVRWAEVYARAVAGGLPERGARALHLWADQGRGHPPRPQLRVSRYRAGARRDVGARPGCAAVSYRPEDGDEGRLIVSVEAREPGPDLARRCHEVILSMTGLDAGLVVVLVPGTLPRTSPGKVRRGDTLRQWLGGTLVAPEKATPWMLAAELAEGTLGSWRRSLALDR